MVSYNVGSRNLSFDFLTYLNVRHTDSQASTFSMAESRGHSPAAVDMRRNKGGTPQPGGGGGGGGQAWDALVNVVLIEGKELLAMDFEGTSDPYCKFRSVDRCLWIFDYNKLSTWLFEKSTTF